MLSPGRGTLDESCCCLVIKLLRLFAAPWTVARQAPLSMGFSRHGYWSELPFPSPGDLPDPGIESGDQISPALAGRFFTTSITWKPTILDWDCPKQEIFKLIIKNKKKFWILLQCGCQCCPWCWGVVVGGSEETSLGFLCHQSQQPTPCPGWLHHLHLPGCYFFQLYCDIIDKQHCVCLIFIAQWLDIHNIVKWLP